VIEFDKAMTNGKCNSGVADSRADLSASTGLSSAELNLIPEEFYASIVDEEIAIRVAWEPIGGWFQSPFSTKSEPNKRVRNRPLKLSMNPFCDGLSRCDVVPGNGGPLAP
jgi:hypothetical protein